MHTVENVNMNKKKKITEFPKVGHIIIDCKKDRVHKCHYKMENKNNSTGKRRGPYVKSGQKVNQKYICTHIIYIISKNLGG